MSAFLESYQVILKPQVILNHYEKKIRKKNDAQRVVNELLSYVIRISLWNFIIFMRWMAVSK